MAFHGKVVLITGGASGIGRVHATQLPGGLFSEVSAPQIAEVMRINYFGMVNISQTVLPYMVGRNAGDFIVYGSIAGIVVSNRFGDYGATKAASL